MVYLRISHLLLVVSWWNVVQSVMLPTLNWDPRNPIFKKQKNCNDDHAHISVDFGSEFYFVCPSIVLTNGVLQQAVSKSTLYENMYIVTKEEFDDCRVGDITKQTRKVLTCDKPRNPDRLKYKKMIFTDLKSSNQLSFSENHTYYFIATSNGTMSGLNSIKGGRCKSHRMKIAITICRDGANCFKKTPACMNPVVKVTQAPTTKKIIVLPDEKKVVVVQNVAPRVSKKITSEQRKGADDTSSNKIVISVIGATIAGLILGVAGVLLAQRLLRKRSKKTSLQGSGEVFTVAVHEDPVETLRREANRKYFSDENSSEYRNSTEFKRLLSTSSGSSSERYSVIKVGDVS